MSDLRYIGKPSKRPEAPEKVAGRAVYIQDLTRPGMLYGQIKYSDHAHARIKHVDTSKAQALPGVHAVITGYDTPRVTVGFLGDNCALKRDKVRQFRDEIAAVAATDPETARAAVDLIEVEYEPLPGVFDAAQALEPDAPLVHETDPRGRPVTTNRLPLEYHHTTGDLAAAKQRAAFVVEGSYSVPAIQQSCMGTAGCIAEFDLRGNLTIWAKTQIPFLAQRDFNRALVEMGIADGNSRVIVPTLGGGFGTGLDTHCYEYISILLAHRTGRPVKILHTREEEFANLSPRQSAETRVVQGCDATGQLVFREVEVLQDNGAYASWGATYPTVMLLPVTSLYKVPVVQFDAQCVYTNNTYCQAMRGYGNPEVTWAIESNLDDLAEKAGIGRYEIRRINCNETGEQTPMELEITSCGLDKCLEATARGLDWDAPRPPRIAADGGRRLRGVGMASLIHVGGSGRIYRSDASGLIFKLDDFGNVNVSYGGVEMGQGLHATLTASVADSLGVRPERVHINQTDTGTCPWDVGTHASRGAFMACSAAVRLSARVRTRLFAEAKDLFPGLVAKQRARFLKQNPGTQLPEPDLAALAANGTFDLRDSMLELEGLPDAAWARVELGRLLRAMHFRRDGTMITEDVFYDPPSDLPDWGKGMGNMSAAYTYGTQGVEVEVDEDTGEVTILKMVSALDVGKVLNPPSLEGQTYGGIAQGVGYALYEQVQMHEGRILNPGFTDYKIPTIAEMDFPIEMVFVESDEPNGPYGAKGAGEPGLVPTAPAIGNAIQDAIGVRLYHLPLTPEKVLAALQAKRAESKPSPTA